jgi:hypothetical protein
VNETMRLFGNLLARAHSIEKATALKPKALVITIEQANMVNREVPGGFGPGKCMAYGYEVWTGDKAGLFYEVEVS